MPGKLVLRVYDRERPVCRNACLAAHIRKFTGELQTVCAREYSDIRQETLLIREAD
jgi:hypothetical protein